MKPKLLYSITLTTLICFGAVASSSNVVKHSSSSVFVNDGPAIPFSVVKTMRQLVESWLRNSIEDPKKQGQALYNFGKLFTHNKPNIVLARNIYSFAAKKEFKSLPNHAKLLQNLKAHLTEWDVPIPTN